MRDHFEKFKATHRLPSPTGVALELLRLAENPNATLEEFTSIVRRDPAISTRILQLANCASSGMRRHVASLDRAVVMLGRKTVTTAALCFSLISQHRQGRCVRFRYDSFWSDCLARAAAARVFAAKVGNHEADDAYTCGLLCQIGRLAFATADPEGYAQVLESIEGEDPNLLIQRERKAYQIDHAALAAEMMADWRSPEVLIEAVGHQYGPAGVEYRTGAPARSMARLLQLAALIGSILTEKLPHRDLQFALVMQANRIGITPESLTELFDRIRIEWQELGRIMSIGTRPVPPLSEVYARARQLAELTADEEPPLTRVGEAMTPAPHG
jgi:HD-like signal output (HDOD) protein